MIEAKKEYNLYIERDKSKLTKNSSLMKYFAFVTLESSFSPGVAKKNGG